MAYEFQIRRSFPYCTAERVFRWSALTPAEAALLEKEQVTSHHVPGEMVFRQDDPSAGIHYIEEGYVLVSRVDALGNETTFGIFGPQETIGHRSFFAEDLHIASARAITPCKAFLIPPGTLRKLFASNADLAWWFLRTIASDRGPPDGLLLRGNGVHTRLRMIRLLLVLRDRFARRDENGQLVIELPLSRAEIANMVGVAPETVTRTIREIEDERLAVFRGRRVLVPNPDLLERAGQLEV